VPQKQRTQTKPLGLVIAKDVVTNLIRRPDGDRRKIRLVEELLVSRLNDDSDVSPFD
jgi:hypothetical protein